ncbi:hypothetical protein Tco_1153952 [Tanacetum coccineum]
METEAIDNQTNLVNYDNENEYEIEDLGYESEEYTEDADEDDENNHSNGYAKRGITRLCKFRREYGKPGGVKLSVTFDALNRISGKHKALFSSFLGDMVREHIGLQILSWKKVGPEARNKLWDEITIEKKEIEQDEEPTHGTLWLKGRVNKDGEYQDDEIRSVRDKLKETEDKIKEGTLQVDQGTDAMTLVLGKEKGGGQLQSTPTQLTPLDVSPVEIHPINSSADEEGGTTILGCDHNDASIQKEMQKKDYGTTVLDVVGGFVAWPKNQVVFDPKATPPSTIQMITVENKTAPKVPTKRKNFYVSSDAMQKEANKKRSQKALVY